MSNILYIQSQMNAALANRSFKKAYKLFIQLNELREKEGIERLSMSNLEKRFEK